MDWKKDGFVTPAKNQGGCASCVPFSISAAIESHNLKNGNNASSDLAEQQLLDCTPDGSGVYRCKGNNYEPMLKYLVDNNQISETDYPYEEQKKECRAFGKRTVSKVTGFTRLTPGEEHLQRAMATHGPVMVGIHAGWDFFGYYGGILTSSNCNGKNNPMNHAVLVIGYGSENGEDFWLLKNSYGERWGEDGFFKLKRNAGNMCKVADYTFTVNVA